MDIKINQVNRQEILKYLGYRGSIITDEINRDIDLAIEEIKQKSNPKYLYKILKINREIKDGEEVLGLEGTNFTLLGQNIKDMLKECDECIFIAVTLGVEIDKLIRINEKRDFAKSIILDACASSLIESLCNQINDDLEDEYNEKKLYLTDRFSPGYGDFPIHLQKDFLNLMNAEKTIGLSTNSSGIMIPRKSITAILGISDKVQEKRFSGCENCNLFMSCSYRRTGIKCGRMRKNKVV